MPPRLELQLERMVDEAVKNSSLQALEAFLEDECNERINPKCSKQFVNKLDKLVNRELDKGNIKHASLGLTCLHTFGRTLTTQNGQGAQKFWVEAETHNSEELLTLAEDFMDALVVVHESSTEGSYQVTASFLHHLCQLVAEGKVHILIQKEVIRKLNVILEKSSAVFKKQSEILSSAEISDVMKKLASRILKCGDYDLQIALVETLCRMTMSVQRRKLAPCWFTMDFVVTAFNDIKDSEFETDCRKFLNLVNGMQGDRRRVYSYPCVEVFLGKHELQMPLDEKLDEFWIDFNLGSHSISFYCSVADEEAEETQWDTVIILENEVLNYTVKEEESRKVLNLVLTEPLLLSGIEGSEVFIHFSTSLDVLQAVIDVYGAAKHKRFEAKRSNSVVKTSIQIIQDEAYSQAFVPESQVSSAPSVDRSVCGPRKISPKQPAPYSGPQETKIGDPPVFGTVQVATPAKMKVSESSTFVSSSGGRRVGVSPISDVLSVTSPTPRIKVKPALDMVKSSERKKAYDIRDLMMTKTSLSFPTLRAQCQLRSDQNSTTIAPPQKKAIEEDSRFGSARKNFHTQHTSVDTMLDVAQTEQECLEQVLGENTNVVSDTQAPERTRPMWRRSVSTVQLSVQGDFSSGLATQSAYVPRAVLNDSFKQLTPNEDMQCAPGDTSCQQLHAQLTQRLEKLLHEREQEAASVKNQVSSKQKGTRGRSGRTVGRKKVQQWGREVPPKPLEPTRVKSGSTVQKLQEGNPNSLLPIQFTGIKNSKEKEAETAALTGRMTSFISNKYKTGRSMQLWSPSSGNSSKPQKRCSLTSMEKGVARHSGFLKASNQLSTAAKPEDDVYSFQVETSEGDKSLKSSEPSAIDTSSVMDSTSFSRALKKRSTSVKGSERYIKKHLFSDTETDNKTDISWIRESSWKTKPKVADYSRRRPQKPTAALNTTWESPDLPPPSPKVSEKQAKQNIVHKERQKKNTLTEKKKTYPVLNRTSGRPQRASAIFKSYKEPSESDSTSQSETEHVANEAAGKVERNLRAAQLPNRKKKPAATKLQARGRKESWTSHPASFIHSPPTERMRSGEKPVELPRSPISPLHSLSMFPDGALSPSLEVPKYQKEVKSSSRKTNKTDSSGKGPSLHTFSPLKPRLTPPLLSPCQPLPSSIVQEMSGREVPLNCQLLDDEQHESGNSKGFPASMNKDSPVSMKTPAYSSWKSETAYLKMHPSGPCTSLKRYARPITFSTSEEEEEDEEKEKSGRRTEQRGKLKPRKLFKPNRSHPDKENAFTLFHTKWTPRGDESAVEDEEVEENRSVKVRKAIAQAQKGFHGMQRESTIDTEPAGNAELHSVVSSHMMSSCWEASVEGDMDLGLQELCTPEDLGSVCHQFSSELQRKLQIRSRRMDLYGKQSMKTFQQHLSSINKQMHQYRTQNLEKVKSALLEEIRGLEQDDSSLKNLEEELTTYWNKQCQAFHSIKLKGTHRLQNLRSMHSTDVSHSLEFEEQIFKSEMCLMRKDMKSIQDKLFRDTHEEELLSVRRGLQALFLTGRGL